jgi:hypothetical protein
LSIPHVVSFLFEVAGARKAMSATAMTARHGKSAASESASEPGINDFAQVAGYKGDDPNAVSLGDFLQPAGNRAADESLNAQSRQFSRSLFRQGVGQRLLLLAGNLPGLDLDNPNPSSRVEYRSDPVLPVCEGGSCGRHCHPTK